MHSVIFGKIEKSHGVRTQILTVVDSVVYYTLLTACIACIA
jgi:hypothetical protein